MKVSTSEPQSLVAVIVKVLSKGNNGVLSSSCPVWLLKVKVFCSMPLKITFMLLRLFTLLTVARKRKAALLSVVFIVGLVTLITGGVQFRKLILLLIWSVPQGLVYFIWKVLSPGLSVRFARMEFPTICTLGTAKLLCSTITCPFWVLPINCALSARDPWFVVVPGALGCNQLSWGVRQSS